MLKERLATLSRSLTELTSKEISRSKESRLFRNLEFKEKWQDDKTRTEILRLIDYARFAEEKNDYQYARRFYEEANRLQETSAVTYFLGRNAYLQGDLADVEAKWRKVIEWDKHLTYPEMRLYLALILYEEHKDNEAIGLMADYLKAIGTGVSQQEENLAGKNGLLSISDIAVMDKEDTDASLRFTLRVSVKARDARVVDRTKTKIQVFFYDTQEANRVILTDADVSYLWITPRHDWSEANPEILGVVYSRPKKNSGQKYLGYIVRIYYSDQLQAVRAEPEGLLKLFPAPAIVPDSAQPK